MYDWAIETFEKLIADFSAQGAFDPSFQFLHTASFQLGLLYLTQGQPDQAAQTWALLVDLPESDPLRLFSLGLQHLAKDEFTQCQALLEEGIKNNHSNPALNTDMQRILGEIAALSNQTAEPQSAVIPEKSPQPVSSVYLQAYHQSTEEDDNTVH